MLPSNRSTTESVLAILRPGPIPFLASKIHRMNQVIRRIDQIPRATCYLVVELALVALIATVGSVFAGSDAQVAASPSTSAHLDISNLVELLAARGLTQGAMLESRGAQQIATPLSGDSVVESIVALSSTGEAVNKATTWNEPLGSGFLEVQETAGVAGQTTTEYWLLTSDHRRCLVNGDATYGKDGRLLSNNFWRNDQQLHFAGSPELPENVFPSRIPPSAFLPALNALEPGATGKLNVVLGRYGFMTFDLWAQDSEPTSVPAGTFRTLKVIMRVDADSVMKYWPTFLRQLAQPFFPKNVLYYDLAPPHHLVKFVGSLGYMAPEVTVQMTRSYIATASARDNR
jgi:hypothetical protein